MVFPLIPFDLLHSITIYSRKCNSFQPFFNTRNHSTNMIGTKSIGKSMNFFARSIDALRQCHKMLQYHQQLRPNNGNMMKNAIFNKIPNPCRQRNAFPSLCACYKNFENWINIIFPPSSPVLNECAIVQGNVKLSLQVHRYNINMKNWWCAKLIARCI